MSAFKAALGQCNLTIAEAAEFLGLGESMVKHYSSGARQAPPEVWAMLAGLHDRIVEMSEHALDAFEYDEITSEAIQSIALREYGEPLPSAALRAVIAIFVMTRMLDDD